MTRRTHALAFVIACTSCTAAAFSITQELPEAESKASSVAHTEALARFDAAWGMPNGSVRDVSLAAFAEAYQDADLAGHAHLVPLARLVIADDDARPRVIGQLAKAMLDGGAMDKADIDRMGGPGMTRTIVEQVVAPAVAGMISRGDAIDYDKAIDLFSSTLSPAEAYLLVGSELKRSNRAAPESFDARFEADERLEDDTRLAIANALDRVVAGQRSMMSVQGLQMIGASGWAPASKGVNEMGFRAVQGPTLTGETVRSNDHLGKVVVIHYWDSTCSGCTKQSKELVELRKTYKEDELVIIGVNMDRSSTRKGVARSAKALGMEWDHIYTGQAWNTPAAKDNEVYGIPLVVVLDREGRPRDSSMGMRRLMDDIRLALAEG